MTEPLKIVIYPDARLDKISSLVTKVDTSIRKKLEEMVVAMRHYSGIGLAGVQVGIMEKLIVIDHDDIVAREGEPKRALIGKPLFLINAEVIELGFDKSVLSEGCLSLPNVEVDVERSEYVKAKYLDENGKKCIIEASGLLAKCIQHEIDHTNGKVILNYLQSALKREVIIKKLLKYKKFHTDCACH